MPYCGRYGCGCCTCKDCGTYNGCVCTVKSKTLLFLKKIQEHRNAPQDSTLDDYDAMSEAIDLLDDWQAQS